MKGGLVMAYRSDATEGERDRYRNAVMLAREMGIDQVLRLGEPELVTYRFGSLGHLEVLWRRLAVMHAFS